jgi:23S rRNA (cytidine1920-2'-O)/16S rRNA (cytidine1409-2'-O)-methyltransferase
MAKRSAKQRLDTRVTELGLAASRSKARGLIRAGLVRVDGQVSDKPGSQVARTARIGLESPPPFVSRGGEKLEAAMQRFQVEVEGMVAADVGASTGGFSDCLLQRGARRVYAIDVGYGQLDWGLRNDPRVVSMERTNARHLTSLAEPVDLVVVDVSFISVALILPAAIHWLKPDGQVIVLIKPQFEAGRAEVKKGGVVRDPSVRRRVVQGVLAMAGRLGLGLRGLMESPLRGPKGNAEYLAWWGLGEARLEPAEALAACFSEGEADD